MKITKFGHCCLLVEIAGKRVLTDPGAFSVGYEGLTDIDIILITHEHADHCHTDSIAAIVATNPDVTIVANSSVARILKEKNLETSILEGRQAVTIDGLSLEAYDGPHAEIFETFGLVQNTGYLLAESFFYPGDSYIEPGKPVEVLALPVAGPWCKSSEALAYALRVMPAIATPVHDAVLSEDGIKVVYGLFARTLSEHGVAFQPLTQGEPQNFI